MNVNETRPKIHCGPEPVDGEQAEGPEGPPIGFTGNDDCDAINEEVRRLQEEALRELEEGPKPTAISAVQPKGAAMSANIDFYREMSISIAFSIEIDICPHDYQRDAAEERDDERDTAERRRPQRRLKFVIIISATK